MSDPFQKSIDSHFGQSMRSSASSDATSRASKPPKKKSNLSEYTNEELYAARSRQDATLERNRGFKDSGGRMRRRIENSAAADSTEALEAEADRRIRQHREKTNPPKMPSTAQLWSSYRRGF